MVERTSFTRGLRVAKARPGVGGRIAAIAAACCLAMLVLAQAASATTYTATQTIPVPPSSTFPGASGGGDGWAVALSNTQVFNVFHHQGYLGVECHNQADGSTCWPDDPTYITDGSGDNFATSGQPGMYLDQAHGKLYVYATRSSDDTAGVVCVDVSNPTADPTFCGFTALSAVGAGYVSGNGAISDPMQVGTKLYAFNYFPSAGVAGTQNQLLCFDTTTDAACAGQPFTVNVGLAAGTTAAVGNFPAPATAAIDGRLLIPMEDTDGNRTLACWDPSTGADCAGEWPISLNSTDYYPGGNGAPVPMLDSTGDEIGLCLPSASAPCFDFTGASVTTPAGLPAALSGGESTGWNGPGVVIGPRVYIPQWSYDVACFDFSTGASCAGFPKYFNGLDLLYTVNLDPQRPTCIWVNSDNGADQIQNFDAFGGNGCGQGAIRVLASQFVVPNSACFPASYQSLQITDPPASDYDTSGSPNGSNIQFEDTDGNPIAGVGTQYLDATGSVGLTGLDLNGPLGLPQFLISIVNPLAPITSITVELTWTATYNPSCVPQGGGVTPTPTTTATSLSGGGVSGASITVAPGTAVTDSTTLSGTDAGAAGGTVTYSVYSDANCTQLVSGPDQESITTAGTMPDSQPVTLNIPGTYYWQAAYSGDPGNDSSTSQCGSEVETITGQTSPQPTSLSTSILAGNGAFGPAGTPLSDQASLAGANVASASGTVTYDLWSDVDCTVPAVASQTVSVSDGVVPASSPVVLPEGLYYYTVSYSGDALNDPSYSGCRNEGYVVLGSARFGADVGVQIELQPASPESAGSDFTVCVTVTNFGPKAAKNIVAGLLLGKGLTVVDPAGATVFGRLLIWKPGTFYAGESSTYSVTVEATKSGTATVTDGALSLGTIDPNYHNNFASEGLTINGADHVVGHAIRDRQGSVFLARLRAVGRELAKRSR